MIVVVAVVVVAVVFIIKYKKYIFKLHIYYKMYQ